MFYNDEINREIEAKTSELVSILESQNYEINDLLMVKKAINYAQIKHFGQMRKSSEPQINHALQVAIYLGSWKMDVTSVVAGILHDIIEDTDTTYKEISEQFSVEIAEIINSVNQISNYSKQHRNEVEELEFEKGDFLSVFISLSKDLRAIVVKLADRLRDVETLKFLSTEKQKLIAKETMHIYALVAGRIGMYELKSKLLDLTFKITEPETYNEVSKLINKLEEEARPLWKKVQKKLQQLLEIYNIDAKIESRIKSVYSIHKKLERGFVIETINDLFALRIITENESDCYQILGLIHLNYIYYKTAFKDYISCPKWNLYQSIHTTIIYNKFLIEFQIRTLKMHKNNELGIAAHWSYKENPQWCNLEVENKFRQHLISETLTDNFSTPLFIKKNTQSQLKTVFVINNNTWYQILTSATVLDLAYKHDKAIFFRLNGVFRNSLKCEFDSLLEKGDFISLNYSSEETVNHSWLNHCRLESTKKAITDRLTEIRNEIELDEQRFLTMTKEILQEKMVEEKTYMKRISYLGFKNLTKLLTGINLINEPKDNLVNLFTKDQIVYKKTYIYFKKLLASKIFWSTYFLPLTGIIPKKIEIATCCSKVPDLPIIGVYKNDVLTVHRHDCKHYSINQAKLLVMEWDQQNLKLNPRLFKVELRLKIEHYLYHGNQIARSLIIKQIQILQLVVQPLMIPDQFEIQLIVRLARYKQLEQAIEHLNTCGYQVLALEII